ncbi:EcsC family protein [Myxacorys almedinensis]|uniref:EcsC family protein n=1 Tax=Myxacorys almedinensis A TaxID=2690445 RepID=A0A8J7Z2G4_9CYAN|nr:EcsC family protein [Myxacorys almedinensis]NDJ19152.1 EcsC family protein [Myxacorys almedinensis A]
MSIAAPTLAEKTVEFFDWILGSDANAIAAYVENLRSQHPHLDRQAIARKIVDEQAFNNGWVGAATGLVGLSALALTLPLDVIRTWKIQDFTIKAIAYAYGHTPYTTDLKTAVFLLMSNGSFDELKEFAINETANVMKHSAFNAVDLVKTSSIRVATKEAPKYLAEALCRVSGRKLTEKLLQRSTAIAVPIIGATLSGGVDWLTTQAVGNLAIEFFENSGLEFVNSLGLPPS